MFPPSSGRNVRRALPRIAPRLLRTFLLALFLSGGSAVLVILLLPWLPSGAWQGELFAGGGLVTLVCPVLGVVLDASLAEPGDGATP